MLSGRSWQSTKLVRYSWHWMTHRERLRSDEAKWIGQGAIRLLIGMAWLAWGFLGFQMEPGAGI